MSDTGRTVVPQTKMRRAIARAMSQSKSTAPHFYVTTRVDMADALTVLDELNAGLEQEERVSLTALIVKAVALTLVDEPRFNAHWTEGGHELIDEVNVGVAIALADGLIAPAILECAQLGPAEIARRLRDLAYRSRDGRLRPAELMGATFTVSNLGMFGVSSFIGIVNPPQVAILATGRTEPRPHVVSGEIEIRPMMTATLSADHRAVDGADSARFLETLKARLEQADFLEGSP